MDYRSTLHSTGNYRLDTNGKHYLIDDAIWRCKTDDEKEKLFMAFLSDKKSKPKQKYITSKDGTLTLQDKAKGKAKNPNVTTRPVNVRSNKRW